MVKRWFNLLFYSNLWLKMNIDENLFKIGTILSVNELNWKFSEKFFLKWHAKYVIEVVPLVIDTQLNQHKNFYKIANIRRPRTSFCKENVQNALKSNTENENLQESFSLEHSACGSRKNSFFRGKSTLNVCHKVATLL